MNSIKPFIDLGWHTVPLAGELKRLDNGKKTTPIFPENFKEVFTQTRNEKPAALGGVMTGAVSGIMAIDCDNEATYNIFCALDPTYKFHFVSKGKGFKAGTIIYKFNPEFEESFSVRNGRLNLDFYSTKGFIYLPTDANKTKEAWTTIPTLSEAPLEVLALLKSLKPVQLRTADAELAAKTWVMHLAPQLKQFVVSKTVTKSLFRIITPKDFRTTDDYLTNGFCHPKNIHDGRGSEYLSKVSAILGADESVDEELYTQAMTLINQHFSEPMDRKRLNSTIIEPMIEERAKINGQVIWRYNKNWEDNLTILVTKNNSSLHVFFDMTRKSYFAVDIANEEIHEFGKDTELHAFLEAVTIDTPSKKELKVAMPLVKVFSTPKYPFGFFGEKKDTFNTFAATTALAIFKNPETYAKSYSPPNTILTFLSYLIPDDFMRNYFLKFLRRKLDTFDYSPVVLYFLGASGSGKDLLIELLEALVGVSAVAKPRATEFIEKHNGWMLDKYFAQLDEYGDQLTKFHDQEMVKGLIKTWSGKPVVSIREMRTDSFTYEHNITFIMTANKNPITFDADDRRIAVFETPNRLRFQPMVEEVGLEQFVKRVFNEVNDFAYYLAVHRDNATLEEYMTPPETQDKQRLIASRLNAGAQIAYLLSNGLFKDFEELASTYNRVEMFNNSQDGKLYEDDLFELYMDMTEEQGTKRGLTLAMKQFEKLPTTRDGKKAYWYKIPGFRRIKSSMTFTPIEGDI